MALIIVLSVMNGFQKEVRDKMLSVLSHAEVLSIGAPIPDWQKTAAELKKQQPEIIGAAPFLRGQGLLTSGTNVRGVQLNGIDPETESQVSDVAKNMKIGRLSDLKPGEFKIILGTDLARMLGVIPGEKVNVMVPQGQFTPAGTMPRMRQFTVAGVFNSGHYEFDSAMSFINLTDAEKLMRTQTPGGIRLKLSNMQDAPRVAAELNNQMPPGLLATDWSRQNRTWFAAVQVEKRMMGIILFLIVLVGAFGLVSSLVMTVNSKRSDIAILRTQGATRGSIMRIFMVQGAFIGTAGVLIGVGVGLLIACNVGSIVGAIEQLFGVQFLPKEIYFISAMPSDPRASDVIPIAVFSFLLALAATVYPSWRAANIQPAEALRYE
ncbi:lipoprotein releasing system, transmembrane protein, LolC/E family [Parasutterella excrementihominis YIT 11859]|uniref:Lipoprotein releasing system, transmembrane protein, LolC/E family n=5 Tax=Sutterellaceae TaxID=995019 RepID=F3QKT4_9BURK|nr:lipoprotein releasing system, transmembrane protein, LolC/E family [Parasutterella excrementihominis YIT 11859]